LNDAPGSLSGSGHSAHLALSSPHRIVDGTSRVVLMDADLVYDPSILAELASAPGARSKTLVCGRFRETDEEVMVFVDAAGTPRVHGKGLRGSTRVHDLRCIGEATGILLLEPADHDAWRRASAWTMDSSPKRLASEHEDTTQLLFDEGLLDAVVFDDDRRFLECDTPNEYDHARRLLVPSFRHALDARARQET
jgi:choline kinase